MPNGKNAAEIAELGYALAKQVPAMERGFTIQTSYGELRIDAEDAPRIARVIRSSLQKQLKHEEARHG